MTSELTARQLAVGWLEAWMRFDMGWLRRHLSPTFVHESPFGRFDDREEYLAAIEPLARKSVAEIEILDVVETGNQAAIRFENRTPAGVVESCDWIRAENGVIREIRSFYDAGRIREVLSPEDQRSLDGKASPAGGAGSRTHAAQPAPEGYSRLCPYLNFEDTGAMLAWLKEAFGLEERHRVSQGDVVTHAEMQLGEAVVMMGSPGGGFRNPRRLGQSTQSLYVFVDDVDAHCDQARKAGAEIIEEPADQDYGHRRYGAADPEGHRWYFAMAIQNDRQR